MGEKEKSIEPLFKGLLILYFPFSPKSNQGQSSKQLKLNLFDFTDSKIIL